MKKYRSIIHISIFAGLILGLVSCELDEYNPSGSTAEAVWSTPEGFETAVNAAYDYQRNNYGKVDGLFFFETGTDLWFNKEKQDWAAELSKYKEQTPSSTPFNIKIWRFNYKGLNQCNAGIGRIDDAGFTNEEYKNQKEGELRFLRAWYLWHIVETYGGVYLSTEESDEPILTAQRSSPEAFYEVIINDLEFAAEHLPTSWGDAFGRASKKSAMGLLARMYLYRASYDFGTDEDYRKARDMAVEVINRQDELETELWDDYADLWDPDNDDGNKEALFTIHNSENQELNFDPDGNKMHTLFNTPYDEKPGLQLSVEMGYGAGSEKTRMMPTRYVLDVFDEEHDARYLGSFQEAWYCNDSSDIPVWTDEEVQQAGLSNDLIDEPKYSLGDTALWITKQSVSNEASYSYIVIDIDSVYNEDGTIREGYNYVHLTKWDDPLRDGPAAEPGSRDFYPIRLAEMYIIAGEAEFQLGNNTEAAGHINVIRRRAAISGHEDDMEISGSDISREFILDERAREFAGELFRWFTIKRMFRDNPTEWVKYLKSTNPDITLVNEHHMLRPIPQEELDALENGGEFGQNPGFAGN